MNQKIELKPFTSKENIKYKVIQITDIALHTSNKTPTPSVGKKIQRAFKVNKPDRIYSSIKKSETKDNKAFAIELLKMDPDFIKMVQKEEKNGFKVLIALPKEGIPVFAGGDTVQFIKSKNGKRIIRGLAKHKNKE